MARPRKFTDREFLEQYRKAEDMVDLGRRLNVTTVSAYKHCARMQLPPINNHNNDELSMKIFRAYRGEETLATLGDRFKMSMSAVRYNILRGIALAWGLRSWPEKLKREKKLKALPTYALPKRLAYVKLAQELIEDETLFDDAEQLASRTGIRPQRVQIYLKQCFDQMSRDVGRSPVHEPV